MLSGSKEVTRGARTERSVRAQRTGRTRAAAPIVLTVALAGMLIAFASGAASAATAPLPLGTATSFSVLAGAGITNTGPTTIAGDIGTFPTPTESGLGSVTLGGTDHAGDAVTQQAKTDLTTAYNTAVGSGPPTSVATELGGTILTPGVYNSPTLGITGTLTLDTLGDPNAVFIFQTASTLITASNSSVIVLNGAQACNVYWQIGSSATLGVNSHLIGSVLASTSITATTGATIQGRLLAENGAVTLDSNTITNNTCASLPTTTISANTAVPTTAAPTAVPTTAVPTASNEDVANYFRFLRFLQGLTTTTTTATGTGIPSVPDLTTSTVDRPNTTTSSAIPPTLAFTGSDARPIYLGLISLAAGVALAIGARRRRR